MAPMKITSQEIDSTLASHGTDFTRLASLFSTMTTQFGASDQAGLGLTPQIKRVSNTLVKAARSYTDQENAAKLIFTAFQKVLSDRSPLPHSRKQIVYYIANQLFKLYFRLGVIRQFDSISKNIVSSGVEFGQYAKADRVGYRYYLGRYYLTQQNYKRARQHLLWSYDRCLNAAAGNKRLILVYLITASLPLGIFPSDATLSHLPAGHAIFGPLMHAMRKGNLAAFHAHLDRDDVHDWLDTYGVWWYLNVRCDLLIYRSLFRRTFLLTFFFSPSPTSQTHSSGNEGHSGGGNSGGGNSGNTRRLPTVKFTHLLAALHTSTRDTTYTYQDVETLLVTLIEAGYIKGYIHHTQRLLVLDRRDERTFGFISGRAGTGAGAVVRAPDDDETRYA